jgi:formylglycine-generating enzyme required for sulfatase activity
MRLPTEAEWEYAARAGNAASRYSINFDQIAWYDGNSGGKTHVVSQKGRSAWLLDDMLGNVWEWVADWYADRYPAGDATDPRGPASGTLRVLRGGGWGSSPRLVRASYRGKVKPTDYGFFAGVRCAGN